MQRAAVVVLRQRRIGVIGSRKRCFGFDRHEGVDTWLPFRNPVEAGLCRLARGDALLRDRLCNPGQRQQCGFGAHFGAFAARTSKKLAGSRSNGSVPAMGAKPSNAGPMELAIRSATSGLTGTPVTSAIA